MDKVNQFVVLFFNSRLIYRVDVSLDYFFKNYFQQNIHKKSSYMLLGLALHMCVAVPIYGVVNI